jgi:hypothetical protein
MLAASTSGAVHDSTPSKPSMGATTVYEHLSALRKTIKKSCRQRTGTCVEQYMYEDWM